MVARCPTLTLQDIADLANVRRHVVSMWRRRPRARGRFVPFPQPVTSAGVERFDRDEIVEWLAQTGRGNNVEARQDAPAVAAPEGIDLEDVVTMLCLHALTGAELGGLTATQLGDTAERADPTDQLLVREVRAAAGAPRLPRYVDDLVEASYGASDALARVESGRLRRETPERGLTDGLVELVHTVTTAARMHLDDDTVALVPPTDHRLARRLVDGFAGILVDEDPAARARRRRAVIDGIEVLDDATATVHVLSVVGVPTPAALEAVDDLVVTLGPTAVGVVLGPAALLCDPLVGDAERRRSHTLRPGNLALALRLPRGLWKGAHRQSLALWVLAGTADTRSLWLADLDTETVDLDDLASDVLAALRRTEDRAYRYARRADLTAVLAGASVLPRGVRAIRLGKVDAATHLDRIHTATLTTSEPLPGYDVTAVPAPGQIVLRRHSLAELRAAGRLALKRGSRIDPTRADPTGTVRVLAADAGADGVRLDPFDAAQWYPRAPRTEPGDVIFLERPRPTARVDVEGGALVASPSRALRLRPGAPIGPHALAAIINEIAPDGSEWPTWSVPDLPPGEGAALEAALAAAAVQKARLHRQVQALQDLVTCLIQGVAAGAVTLDPTVTNTRAG